MKNTILVATIFFLGLAAFKLKHKPEIRSDFKKYYDQFELDGSFVLYDQQHDTYIMYNPEQFNQTFIPASTFKICNSLIGLETGVIKDEHFVIPWDSVQRTYAPWNKDNDLKSAFKNSTVWYYQELARRVGGNQMKYWLDKAKYGNADTSGGIDQFWLSGGLRISPEQQINFLKRLHNNKLPFSERTVKIVKDIMIEKDTFGYVIRAKTGWGDEKTRYIGWYVGYIEKNGNVYYFANCVQTRGLDERYIARARKEITYRILNDLDIVKQ